MGTLSNLPIHCFYKNIVVRSKEKSETCVCQLGEFAELYYYQGVVRWKFDQNVTIDPPCLSINLFKTWKLVEKRHLPVSLLIDISKKIKVSSEGEDFFRTVCTVKFIDKIAILSSKDTIIQGGILSSIGRRNILIKLFLDEEKACGWIREGSILKAVSLEGS